METTQKPAPKPVQKPAKKKGPIRFEAIVPFAIVCAAVAAYFTFFFDFHLRKGLEWAATRGNGAEANIARVRTSFARASASIEGLQLTDPAKPELDRLRIGQMKLQLSWDALLRAKAVIETARITGIEVGAPRARPGRVLPPDPPSKEPGLTAQLQSRAIDLAKEKIQGTALADAARLLEGMNPAQELEKLKSELKSVAKAEALKAELARKEGEWKSALESLPGQKDADALKARVAQISAQVGNPAEIPARIDAAQKIVGEVDSLVKSVNEKAAKLTGDVNAFGGAIGEIDKLVAEDRKALEARLKLPSLDVKSLGNQLLGPLVLDRVGQARSYIAMARKYMPSKDKPSAKGDRPIPHPRARGRTYEFASVRAYPLFWMKEAVISSTGEHSALGGDVEGRLTDVTSQPARVGKPAVLRVSGQFPKQSIHGVELLGTFDHLGPVAKDSVAVKVASFPVANQMLSQADELKFGFAKALGAAELSGAIEGDRVSLDVGGTFRDVAYEVAARSRPLQEILTGVTSNLGPVWFKAKVAGPWDGLGIGVDTNLASAIASGLERLLKAKVDEARARIDALVRGQVDAKKREVQERFDDAKKKVTGQIDEKRKQIEAVKGQAEAKVAEIRKQGEGAAKKAVDELKNKIKIPNPFGR